LSPITSAPQASSARATSAGAAPYGVRRSAPTVVMATTAPSRPPAGGQDRLLELQQVPEGLQDEQVRAALAQPGHLLGEDRARLLTGRRAVGLDAHPERPQRAGDQQRMPTVRRLVGGLAGQLGRAAVDGADLPLEPVAGQLRPVRPEGVRLQHLGAGRRVRRWTSRTRSGARSASSS
jgi:hypothetical protein